RARSLHLPIALEQLGHEVDRPPMIARLAPRGEPNPPIEAVVVRGGDAGTAERVARFAGQLVFFPLAARRKLCVRGALENDLESLLSNAAEGAVGVDQVERLERAVHRLIG